MPYVILRAVNMVDFTPAIRLDYIAWSTLTKGDYPDGPGLFIQAL